MDFFVKVENYSTAISHQSEFEKSVATARLTYEKKLMILTTTLKHFINIYLVVE